MNPQLILRATSGEVYNVPISLNKTALELLQYLKDKFKFAFETKLIFQTVCLNYFPNKQ